MQSIASLNQQFGINGELEFIQDKHGFIMVDINNHYAKARISTYAGQLVSYKPHSESEELIFLSEKALYQTGKAIRGGVPVCWPWFGDDPLGLGRPSHGFLRNQQWQVMASSIEKEGATKLVLGCHSTDSSKAIWPYDFELTLEVTIAQDLQLRLITKNIGQQDFTITQALHTYFNVSDIEQVVVTGLDGKKYLDKLEHFSEQQQLGDVLVSQQIDRIFQGVDNDVYLFDKGFGRKVTLSSVGSSTTVIWNPWTASITDLDNEHYRQFLCVETANAANDSIVISVGGQHSIAVSYSIS